MNDQYLGQIIIWAGPKCPDGWMFCEGQTLGIEKNKSLFSLIGTMYGGDGISTFALPDFRNRMPLGVDKDTPLGVRGGSDRFTIHPFHLPEHSHHYRIKELEYPLSLDASLYALGSTPADHNTPLGRMLAKESGLDNDYRDSGTKVQMAQEAITLSCNAVANVVIPDQTQPAGGGEPVHFMPPAICLNFMIAVTGIYPNPQ